MNRRSFLQSVLTSVGVLAAPVSIHAASEKYVLLPRLDYISKLTSNEKVSLPLGAKVYQNYNDAVKVYRSTRYGRLTGEYLSVFGVDDSSLFQFPKLKISSQEIKRQDVQNKLQNLADTCKSLYASYPKENKIDIRAFIPQAELVDMTNQVLAMEADEGLIVVKNMAATGSYDAMRHCHIAEDEMFIKLFRSLKDIQDRFVFQNEQINVETFFQFQENA